MTKIISSIILVTWFPLMLLTIMYVDRNVYPLLHNGLLIFLWSIGSSANRFLKTEPWEDKKWWA